MTNPRRSAFIQAMQIHQGTATDHALAAHLPQGKANLAAGAAAFAEAIVAGVRHVAATHGPEAADALVEAMSTTLKGATVTTLLAAQRQMTE
ncbi:MULTISPECIES: hypothetical protein [unclassified Streptomyces]|nr:MULTISPECIES: hypothetical protein [unclassified Streptomyces]MYQ62610.1 hypothetical protein [Streptomyces sp. SID4950]